MIYKKEKFNITVSGTTGAGVSTKVYGRIEQMIITPVDSSGVLVSAASWDCSITDKDGDQIDSYTTETGILNNRTHLPTGFDTSEALKFTFTNITQTPDTMKVILKIFEKP